MKSSRMLILLSVITLQVVVNATDFNPYITGQLTNNKGQTLLHQQAKNCYRLDAQAVELLLQEILCVIKII